MASGKRGKTTRGVQSVPPFEVFKYFPETGKRTYVDDIGINLRFLCKYYEQFPSFLHFAG